MNKIDFLALPEVTEFINYFKSTINFWEVRYISRNPRILIKDRNFDVIGVQDALSRYAWPSQFECPENYGNFIGGAIRKTYDWESTRVALNYLSHGLKFSLDNENNKKTLVWCKRILDWGMGQRGDAAYDHLESMPGGVIKYIKYIQDLTFLNKTDLCLINKESVEYYNSGLSKIHSLASVDGLAIFDSRVAAALCQSINNHLRTKGCNIIPASLRLMRQAPQGRGSPTKRIPAPVGNDNHSVFVTDYRWLDAQIRASWLLSAALEAAPGVFPNEPLPDRIHNLEASLFMMGADIRNHVFN